MSRIKRLLNDYCAVISGIALGRGISFLTALFLARALGTYGFGIFTLFFTVMMLVWQFSGIIDVSYVRYAKAEAKEKNKHYLRATFLIKSGIFAVLICLAYPLGTLLAGQVFNKPEMASVVTMAILSGILFSVFSTLAALYQASERFYKYSLVNLAYYALVLVLLAALYYAGRQLSVGSTIVIYTATAAVLGIFAIIYLYRRSSPLFPAEPAILRQIFHFGKWLVAEQFIYIVLQRLDVLFLARYASFEEIGVYSAAVRMAMFASILTNAVSTVFMPKGCESLRSRDTLKRYLKESCAVAVAISCCIGVLMALSPFMIRLFFGEQYAGSLFATRVLLLEAIFVVLYTPFSYLFYATGATQWIFVLGLAKLASAAAGLFILVPLYGSLGAALSIAVSSLVGLVLVVALSQKIIRQVGRAQGQQPLHSSEPVV